MQPIKNQIRLFIVGAAKAGTTSLHNYLNQHPDIFMSEMKEPHYFSQVKPQPHNRHYVTAISDATEYEKLFESAKSQKVIGESSPSYLWDAQTADRILEYDPSSRIIILLRNPIQRAFSHYLMDVREGIQRRSFAEALKIDQASTHKGWGISHLYVELGMYCQQVQRYLDRFDKKQVLILFYEEFVADIPTTLSIIYKFLNVDNISLPDETIKATHNAYAAPRHRLSQVIMASPLVHSLAQIVPTHLKRWARNNLLLKSARKPSIDPETYSSLVDIYQSEIDCLKSQCKLDVPWHL